VNTFKCLAKRVRKNSPPEKCEIVDGHISPDSVKRWCEIYWRDDVIIAMDKARVWTHDIAESDVPGKLPTKAGLTAFMGNWIRRDCRLKPQARMIAQEPEEKPVVKSEIRQSAIEQMKELLK